MDQAERGGAGGGSRRRRAKSGGEGFRVEGFSKAHSNGFSKTSSSKDVSSKEPSKDASAAGDGAKDAEGGDDASKLGRDPDSKAKEEPEEEEEEEAAWITYDAEGFRKVLDVDLAIAEVCGSDFMLPEDHPEFKRNAECCAKVALEQGYERWPGCGAERGCATVKHSGSSDVSSGTSSGTSTSSTLGGATRRKRIGRPTSVYESDACARKGELAFSPVRAGVYVNQLKRFYEYVPPQNVLVVTADQAFSSGMATLAVVLIEWRMLGLPLVDPVSVTSDLMLATAAASAGAGLSGLENSGLERPGRRIEDGDEAGLSLPRLDVVHQSALRTYPHWRGGGNGGVGDNSDARFASPRRRSYPYPNPGGLTPLARAASVDVASTTRRTWRDALRFVEHIGARGFHSWGWTGGVSHATRKASELVERARRGAEFDASKVSVARRLLGGDAVGALGKPHRRGGKGADAGADAGGAEGGGDVDDAFFEDFSFSPGLRYFAELPRGFAVDTAIDPPTRQKPSTTRTLNLLGRGVWATAGRAAAGAPAAASASTRRTGRHRPAHAPEAPQVLNQRVQARRVPNTAGDVKTSGDECESSATWEQAHRLPVATARGDRWWDGGRPETGFNIAPNSGRLVQEVPIQRQFGCSAASESTRRSRTIAVADLGASTADSATVGGRGTSSARHRDEADNGYVQT